MFNELSLEFRKDFIIEFSFETHEIFPPKTWPSGMRVSDPPPLSQDRVHGVLDSRFSSLPNSVELCILLPENIAFKFWAQDPCQTRRGLNLSLPPRRRCAFRLARLKYRRPSSSGFKNPDSLHLLSIFVLSKTHPKLVFSQTPQNLKSPPLSRRFGLICGAF